MRAASHLPADLLPTSTFCAPRGLGQNQEALYEEFWKHFDDSFWREEVKQGWLVRPRSDLFMQHFLASRIGEDMPIKHLFVEYKHWVERTDPFDGSIREELSTLARQGDHFRRIVEPKKGTPYIGSPFFSTPSTSGPPTPAADVARSADRSVGVGGVFEDLESYLLHRAICVMNTNNYNRIFLQLTKGLRRDDISIEILTKQLTALSGEFVDWPSERHSRTPGRTGQPMISVTRS